MPELEELLKTFDAFIQTPNGPEADRLKTLYEACLAGVENRRRNCDHQLENFLWLSIAGTRVGSTDG